MINLLDVLTKDRELPKGCDEWGIRSVNPDFTSKNGFRWAFPGNWAEAPGPIVETNKDTCPSRVGDGICVAYTWKGMALGEMPASTLLLCAYRSCDILGRNEDKARLSRAYVVDVLDGSALLRRHGSEANLAEADLRGANLAEADLSRAKLVGADLSRANLVRADLIRADLRWADLSQANLEGADLKGTNLRWANLEGADLIGSNLSRANLSRANLSRAYLFHADLSRTDLSQANLRWANLEGSNLDESNLSWANLEGADLEGVYFGQFLSDKNTVWPEGFQPF